MSKQGDKIRSDVLAVLQQRGGPTSAYDVLRELQTEYPKLAPTTIYRALNQLTECGEVHRLESLNAFMLCQCRHHQQGYVLSICDDCGNVEERVAPELLKNISSMMRNSGFAPKRHVIEIHGKCSSCNLQKVSQ